MSLPSYKTDPAFPGARDTLLRPDGSLCHLGEYCTVPQGLTQYAEVAARFHAALLSSDAGHQERASPAYAADRALDHADAFFAELAKRMTT